MSEPTTLGSWLRREREKRGVTLAKISEETKVAVALLEGLEADDLSRWPGGIFRRSFARSYAVAIGLDPELVVRRVEEEHPSEPAEATTGLTDGRGAKPPVPSTQSSNTPVTSTVTKTVLSPQPVRQPAIGQVSGVNSRFQAVALDLLVAGAIGLGFAAAGSRLLWPVMLIAAYHAIGLLLTGTTPMMALLSQSQPVAQPQAAATAAASPEPAPVRRPENEPRQVRRARARRSKDQNTGRDPNTSKDQRIKGSKDLSN